MIHYLFNNIFVEKYQNNNSKYQNLQVKDTFKFPINEENDLALLSILDILDKAQQILMIGDKNNSEYIDIVKYIEINLLNPESLLMNSKLIVMKYKSLFASFLVEIIDDKNPLPNIINNTRFFKEIEHLFSVIHNSYYMNSSLEVL